MLISRKYHYLYIKSENQKYYLSTSVTLNCNKQSINTDAFCTGNEVHRDN